MLFPFAPSLHRPFAGLISGGISCRWNFFAALLTIINKGAQPLCQLLLSHIPTGLGQWGFLFALIEGKSYFVSGHILDKYELRDVIYSLAHDQFPHY